MPVAPANHRRRLLAAGAALSVLALGLVPGGLAAGASGPPSLLLTAAPTTGTAPLLVQFNLTEPSGALPSLAWAFGDGSFLNGSAPADFAPAHDYLAVGTFDCVVHVTWPSGTVNDSVVIHVRSPEVGVALTASATNGSAPLTVWFNATVTGGTGTYLSYLWSFGDGGRGIGLSVRYTYTTPGHFEASLVATDSAGRNGSASAVVNVTAARSSPANGSPGGGSRGDPTISLTAPVAAALLLGGAGVMAALYLGTRRYRSGTVPAPVGPPGGGPTPSPLELPPAPSAPPTAIPAVVPDASRAASDPPERPTPASVRVVSTPLASPTRITDALVRHLAALPKLWPNDLPSKAWTQAGIAEAIGAGQSAVSRVLRRLVAAGVVTVETRHVEGSVRRLRIYRLTERGERLGKALREIRPPPGDEPPGR